MPIDTGSIGFTSYKSSNKNSLLEKFKNLTDLTLSSVNRLFKAQKKSKILYLTAITSLFLLLKSFLNTRFYLRLEDFHNIKKI